MQIIRKTDKIVFCAALMFSVISFYVSAEYEKLLSHNNVLFSINRNNGFEISGDNGVRWSGKNRGLPLKTVYPFSNTEIRTLTSISINPDNDASLSLTTVDSLYISENRGESWNRIELKNPIRPAAYITASSVKGTDGNKILIGTSFSGIFESTDRGITWKSYSDQMQVFLRGAGFYDDISAVSYSSGKYQLFLATGFTKKLYAAASSAGPASSPRLSWIEIEKHPAVKNQNISSMYFNNKNNILEVYAGSKKYLLDIQSLQWSDPAENLPYSVRQHDSAAEKRRTAAEGKTGIYLAAHHAGTERIDRYLDFIEKNSMNSIVVDFKDDNGMITYNTGIKMAASISAVNTIIDVRELVRKAHSRNIYVIARMVVFKDKQLYSYLSGRYAVWDRNENRPWGHLVKADENSYEQREFWVDPFSGDVWDYNISIAEELELLGVDEIQFDYIRFPTDGNLGQILYRHRKEGMSRSEALESFLKKAREKITIPISADLYGFNSWYRKGNWNGQQVDMFADYVDVICPMLYPSHFPAGFLSSIPFLQRAEQIYREGSSRTQDIAAGRSIVRPFVQAFLIGNERKFEQPLYTQYLNVQLNGLFEANAGGFTLWNASGNYYMVSNTMPANITRKDQLP